jgi:hypothetical protein
MGMSRADLLGAPLYDFSIMRQSWCRMNMPPEPGLSKKDAMKLKAEMAEAGYD